MNKRIIPKPILVGHAWVKNAQNLIVKTPRNLGVIKLCPLGFWYYSINQSIVHHLHVNGLNGNMCLNHMCMENPNCQLHYHNGTCPTFMCPTFRCFPYVHDPIDDLDCHHFQVLTWISHSYSCEDVFQI